MLEEKAAMLGISKNALVQITLKEAFTPQTKGKPKASAV